VTRIDRAALAECYRLACAESEDRCNQIVGMVRERGWQAAAEFAAYHCQHASLKVRPWGLVPMQIADIDAALATAPDARGTAAAARLLQLMLAAGLSRFDPDLGRVLA
jgi:hypothetical protein